MPSSPIRAALAVVVVLGAVAHGSREARAQRGKGKGKAKPVSACGVKMFPLTVGNRWTFVPGPAPTQPPEAMVRFIPLQPKQVVVTVASIDVADGKSVVHLEEDVDGRKLETTITCGKDRFEVSPDSLFFAGEPGGYYGIEFAKSERRLVEGAPWAATWREDVVSTWKRIPEQGIEVDLGAGKLEIERRFTLARADKRIDTSFKQQIDAHRLTVEVTGRVTVMGIDKPSEMPANWINMVWFSDGLGPVQVLNSYFHLYQLSDAVLVK